VKPDPILGMLNPRLPAICCLCGEHAEKATHTIIYSATSGNVVVSKTRTYRLPVPVCDDCSSKLTAYSALFFRLIFIPGSVLGVIGCILSLLAKWDFYGVFGSTLSMAVLGGIVGAILNKIFNKNEHPKLGTFVPYRYIFHNRKFCEAFSQLNPDAQVEYKEQPVAKRRAVAHPESA
jgi:hypothetical protein